MDWKTTDSYGDTAHIYEIGHPDNPRLAVLTHDGSGSGLSVLVDEDEAAELHAQLGEWLESFPPEPGPFNPDEWVRAGFAPHHNPRREAVRQEAHRPRRTPLPEWPSEDELHGGDPSYTPDGVPMEPGHEPEPSGVSFSIYGDAGDVCAVLAQIQTDADVGVDELKARLDVQETALRGVAQFGLDLGREFAKRAA